MARSRRIPLSAVSAVHTRCCRRLPSAIQPLRVGRLASVPRIECCSKHRKQSLSQSAIASHCGSRPTRRAQSRSVAAHAAARAIVSPCIASISPCSGGGKAARPAQLRRRLAGTLRHQTHSASSLSRPTSGAPRLPAPHAAGPCRQPGVPGTPATSPEKVGMPSAARSSPVGGSRRPTADRRSAGRRRHGLSSGHYPISVYSATALGSFASSLSRNGLAI